MNDGLGNSVLQVQYCWFFLGKSSLTVMFWQITCLRFNRSALFLSRPHTRTLLLTHLARDISGRANCLIESHHSPLLTQWTNEWRKCPLDPLVHRGLVIQTIFGNFGGLPFSILLRQKWPNFEAYFRRNRLLRGSKIKHKFSEGLLGGESVISPYMYNLQSGAVTCYKGFVLCFLIVPHACLGSIAAAVHINGLWNSQKTF